ncbi:MAG: bifunctional oligoribonuclease/PAP phosphatase NrnA [Sporomusaceae bacterium]|nr:bifunctional oligoribonuclease/PAP phosphatase NrnA [Sporomusaceae bacterium]
MNITLAQAAYYIVNANNVVITGHVHPDGDCLGSMLAVYRLCQQRQIGALLLLDDDIPAAYRFLPDVDRIEKPQRTVQADLLIVVDASDAERIGRVGECVKAPVLNIDHHISNTAFADYLFLDVAAAATGSIIYSLFCHLGIRPDKQTAICLYTAIVTDCGFFRYANTSGETLRHGAELLDCGVEPAAIAEALETKPAGSVFCLIQVLETLEISADGKIAWVTVPPAVMEAAESTDEFINYPRSIAGVEVAIMFKAAEANLIRVSLRSRGVDVSAIALRFGGGGHQRAAGCSIAAPLADAKARLLAAVAESLAGQA